MLRKTSGLGVLWERDLEGLPSICPDLEGSSPGLVSCLALNNAAAVLEGSPTTTSPPHTGLQRGALPSVRNV